MKYRIGIDVGGTKIAYGLYNDDYQLMEEMITPSMPEKEPFEMLDTMNDQVDLLLKKTDVSKNELKGIGAVLPGHINYSQGLIITCANLPKWRNIFARHELEQRLEVPVFLDNDANVGALAEARLGASKGVDNLIYITVSTGIGAGLYLNGQMFRGSYGAAGELGHILQDTTSRIRCGCGRVGCAEAVASGTGMTRYVKSRICEGEVSIISELADGFDLISPYYIAEAAKQGDALALETLDHTSTQLARFFTSLYQIFNVDTLVYGGGVTKIGPLLMDLAKEKFKALTPMTQEYPMKLIETSFPDTIGMIGAALLVE